MSLRLALGIWFIPFRLSANKRRARKPSKNFGALPSSLHSNIHPRQNLISFLSSPSKNEIEMAEEDIADEKMKVHAQILVEKSAELGKIINQGYQFILN